MPPTAVWIGIDVAQAHLDIAVRPSGAPWQTPYTDAALAALVPRLQALRPTQVVLEATGGLETRVVRALAAAGVPVAVVNPRQVRDFAKATGRLAKTDALDAQVLAHFAQAVCPPCRPLPPAATQALQALLTRRRQWVALHTAERNRQRSATGAIRQQVAEHLRWLEQPQAVVDRGPAASDSAESALARPGAALARGARRRARTHADAAGALARTRHAGPQAPRGVGRRRPAQPR